MYLYGWIYVYNMCVDTHRGQKRVVGPLELELEVVVSPHVGVGNLVTKPGSSARVSQAIYPVPIAIINTHSLTSFYHYKVNKTNDPKEEKLQTKSKKTVLQSKLNTSLHFHYRTIQIILKHCMRLLFGIFTVNIHVFDINTCISWMLSWKRYKLGEET